MTAPHSFTIRLNHSDNVVVARVDIAAGTTIPEEQITCRDPISFGHKVAAASIKSGEAVKKYGQIIGFASKDIRAGEHVHTHNVGMKAFDRDYAIGADADSAPKYEAVPATFQGIVRADGRVATRNYIGIISTVNCSASVTRFVADAFKGDALAGFSNVDGVVPICHGMGCACANNKEGFEILLNILAGYIRNPNFAAIQVIGLGCEVMQIDTLFQRRDLQENALLQTMTIQGTGGTRKTVQQGIERVRAMLPIVNKVERTPVSAGHLILGLQCGGSDAYSGITANPSLGAAVDLLVRNGGGAVLGETAEIYGAEHLLTRRAVSREVGEKLIDRIHWWEDYTAKNNAELDNNPSPGNKAGGLTTILEKSLGAVAKGGTGNLVDVLHYAHPITGKGLMFMDTPGYDPVSLTGMVAGGANIICFTTGRGSVYGCKPVPSIKLATNTEMYRRMEDDMDINCGETMDGPTTVEEMGRRIFSFILDVASGRKTKSELNGIGEDEFVPWNIGAVM
ncbi:MAG: altronate dehydratase [Desulfobacterales bacterium]|nr:MAG: altronate dehydratase [Desulfobacterales bacterium]